MPLPTSVPLLPGLPVALGADVFLLSLRIGVILGMSPILSMASIPLRVRALLVLALSVVLASGLPAAATGLPNALPHALPAHLGGWIGAAFSELALGATFALGILFAFAAFTVAGHLLDLQIGFGMAQVFDPVANRPAPMLASLFQLVGVLVFFLVDGHHALLRGIAFSMERFPPGAPWALAGTVEGTLRYAGGVFSLGFALAAPVVFCVLLVELALGVVSRNLPQMNMFVMGIPVKIVAGIAALSLWAAAMGPVMTRVYASIFTAWGEVFAVAAAPALPGAR